MCGRLSSGVSVSHDVTDLDAIIRDCPSHGILGADNNSGSFTLEYSEIFNSGDGTRRHSIYMQSDEVAYPGSVFRMQYNYVHSPTGGVLVRVRDRKSTRLNSSPYCAPGIPHSAEKQTKTTKPRQ